MSVTDVLHGHSIQDPYRWLENEEDPRVAAWVEQQNDATRRYLDAVPQRTAIAHRLKSLLSIGDVGTPVARGRRYFITRREGEQNHAVVYLRDGLDGDDRVLLDPNAWSAAGTTALDWWYPSQDGRYVAYGVSQSGDEKSVLHVVDADSGANLPDSIPHTRACSLAWRPDGTGFYYTRYPSAEEAASEEEAHYFRKVYYHTLGTPPERDPLVFGEGRAREDWPNVDLSPDGRWLLLFVEMGWVRTDVYLMDLSLSQPLGRVLTLAEGEEVLYSGEIVEGFLYLLTNAGAPRYHVFRVDLEQPERAQWKEIIPESATAVIDAFAVIGGRLIVNFMERASSHLKVFDLEGRQVRELPLPTLGSVRGIGGEWNGAEMFFGFNSYTVPPTVYRFELPTNRVERFMAVDADLHPERYEVHQVEYPSRDGTPVTMFLVHPKDLVRNGTNPTLLTGYGGFNISMTPAFQRSTYLWLEQGGLYAVPNLRGGGEYGEGWHRSGMLAAKQNVFDDFVAAAEWLIANGYTRPDRLAISGGSNGGLLVGAALTQRPDLFRAVVCSVPLLDMLRYHHFRIARLWIPEYGSADDPEQFQWLLAYSPYHRVEDGAAYPAVLVMTGESDSRVDPMHARKMTARLQEATASGQPVLLRVETRAGHGAGKPLAKVMDEITDSWSFIFDQLGVKPDPPPR